MPLPAWLAQAAATRPAHPALETCAGILTYADLLDRADRAAGALAARGVGPGDRVALLLGPGEAWVVAFHACLRLGAVALPVDVRLGPAERAAQTTTATVVLEALPEGGGEPRAADLRDTHDPAAVAAVVHTSGSTGAPRPVELTYGNFAASARGSAAVVGAAPTDRWLSTLPLSHVGGLSIVVRSAIGASTAVVRERFDAEATARELSGGGVTLVSLVPTMLARLLDAGLEHAPGLRCALVGGGPLPPAVGDRALAAGLPVAQTYGLTEACSQVTTSEIGDPGTAGRPLPGTAVELAEDGEIIVAGPTVAPGALERDGRLHTGDLGHLDAEGRLTVTGRRADTIVSGGDNVAPAEVEAVLEAHPAVAEAAVHGRRDAEWGEAVVATVVLRPGQTATERELRDHVRGRLAAFKAPKAVVFAASLPRTPSGKLRRDVLD